MPAGVQVYNDSGFFQIDSTYKNLRLTNKGTLTIPPGVNSGAEFSAGTASVLIAGNTPVIAVRCTGLVVATILRTITPTTFQLRGISDTGGVMEYFVFDQVAPSASSGGMQVFDPSGVQVYDSNDKSLRVVDFFEQDNVLPGSSGQTRTYASGLKTAIIPSGNLRYRNGGTGPGGNLQLNWLMAYTTPAANQITSNFMVLERFYSISPVLYVSGRKVWDLVVDVTGY